MAVYYSDQEAPRYTQGTSYRDGYSEVDGNQSITRWTRTTNALDINGNVMYALRLPKGAVIIDGEIVHGALGASVTLSAGSLGVVSGTAAAASYLAATASATAGIKSLFATRALGRLTVLAEETTLTITIGGANTDAGIYLDGWVRFIQN